MTDFDIEVVPGVILEDLQDFNESVFDGKMTVEKIENKCIKLTIPDEEEGGENHTIVKVKFFKLDDARTRVRFIRKTGDLQKWYELFKQMKEVQFEGTLLQ